MNRRSFLGAVTVAAVAGPSAIEQLLIKAQIAAQMRHQAMICMANDPIHGIMQRAYRKMQLELLEGVRTRTAEWDLFEDSV